MTLFASRSALYRTGIPLGVIVAAVALTAFLGRDISSRAGAIRDVEQELASRARAVETLAYLRADDERAKHYFTVLENILPTKDQLIAFPREFVTIAKKYNVTLATSFGSEGPATDTAPGFIEFVFTAEGSFQNILAFLKSAEAGRYIVKWTSFEFLRAANGYSATIAGVVFSR